MFSGPVLTLLAVEVLAGQCTPDQIRDLFSHSRGEQTDYPQSINYKNSRKVFILFGTRLANTAQQYNQPPFHSPSGRLRFVWSRGCHDIIIRRFLHVLALMFVITAHAPATEYNKKSEHLPSVATQTLMSPMNICKFYPPKWYDNPHPLP